MPHISHRTGDGRKHHEEIQINVLADLIQVERAGDFRREDLAELGAVLFQDEVICNHPGTVKDAGKLSVFVFDGGNESLDLIEVAEIQLPIAHSAGLCGQFTYEGLVFGA